MVRALVLQGPRSLELREFEYPLVHADDALLRVEACGLCGTDHEQYSGHLFFGFPFVPGHESVGVVEAIGDEAAQEWGVHAGDRVAVEVFQSCRTCRQCARGNYRHCEQHGVGDSYGFIPVDRPPGLWGGYAQYLCTSERNIVALPKTLAPKDVAPYSDAGLTGYRAVKKAARQLNPGESCVMIGAGGPRAHRHPVPARIVAGRHHRGRQVGGLA